MSQESEHRKKSGLARRIFKAVGTAGSTVGSTVGGFAGGLLRSAGQTAKNAGGRAALSFASEVCQTPPKSLRELAESFTQWLLSEHQGKADLQQQKPSTVELTELGQVNSFYQIWLEEPGILGRRFRFLFRHTPLSDFASNFPHTEESYHDQTMLVVRWPQKLTDEPTKISIAIWDEAAFVGERGPALNLLQQWLKEAAGGTFPGKSVSPTQKKKSSKPIPIHGRDEELEQATELLLSPRRREDKDHFILSLAAPGGTGKSFFLKALRERIEPRVLWAGVDHQGIEEDSSGVALLGRCLAQLARQLEEKSVKMEGFSKELRAFRKRTAEDGEEPGGFFSHLKKAAESAAGINPIFGAASAGVVFITSWGQEAKEESEALAKDNAVKALTDAFKNDLRQYVEQTRKNYVCWPRPVIVFDTYEWLAPLVDTWMRTEFLADDFLQETGICLVLSGREHLLRADTRWSEWQHQVTNISLNPFSRSVSEQFLAGLKVEPERFEDLYRLTEGLPLFLSLAAHIEEPDQAIGILAKRVLEEVEPEHHLEFMKASLLESFDSTAVPKLFPDKDEEQVQELIKRLNKATFTVASEGKRAFLKPVRKILTRALTLEIGEAEVEEIRERL